MLKRSIRASISPWDRASLMSVMRDRAAIGTGYHQGYVQKVFASMSQSGQPTVAAVAPIPLQENATPLPRTVSRADILSEIHSSAAQQDTAAYRVSLRSTSVLDAIAAPLITAAFAAKAPDAEVPAEVTQSKAPTTSIQAGAASTDIFVPKVSYLGDPPQTDENPNQPPKQVATPALSKAADHSPVGDPADLRQNVGDDAFVF
jgi:type IV secretion system protein VirB1